MGNRKNEIATSFLLAMTGTIILLFVGIGAVKAQISKPVKWSFSAERVKGCRPMSTSGRIGVYLCLKIRKYINVITVQKA
jgi:hypothetical protein